MPRNVATTRPTCQFYQEPFQRIDSANNRSQVGWLHIASSLQFLHHAATRPHGCVERFHHIRGDHLSALDRLSDEVR